MRLRRTVAAGFLPLLLAGAGWAAELTDTTTDVVCSITRIQVCPGGAACTPSTPGELGVPDLILVSLPDSAFLALGEAHLGRRSSFKLVEKTAERWVLQGYERKRAWSAIIDADGGLSLAATDTGVAVSASGRCVDAAWLRD
jgi:hypothetical protein